MFCAADSPYGMLDAQQHSEVSGIPSLFVRATVEYQGRSVVVVDVEAQSNICSLNILRGIFHCELLSQSLASSIYGGRSNMKTWS